MRNGALKNPMRTDLFDFELPSASIALRPASPRDSARMLVVQPDGVLRDRSVTDLPQWLEPGDALVVNDTKVIPAQLRGRRIGRDTEPKIEATLIKRLDGSRWQALVKPAKKLSPGDVVRFGNEGKVCLLGHLDAEVEHKGDDGEVTLSFSFHGPALDQPSPISAARRCRPISPPGARPMSAIPRDYQTMFAASEGAVAAPDGGTAFHAARWKRRCASAASAFTGSPCMSGPGPSCRSRSTTPRDTRCMPNGARSPAKPPTR